MMMMADSDTTDSHTLVVLVGQCRRRKVGGSDSRLQMDAIPAVVKNTMFQPT